MKSLKTDTLSFQLGVRAGTQKRVMSHVSVPLLVKGLNAFMGDKTIGHCFGVAGAGEAPKGDPEVDALVFYMLNHAVSVVRQKVHPLEPLGDYLPVVQAFNHELALRSARMFFYMLLICTRESRHLRDGETSSLLSSLTSKYGLPITSFHASIRGTGSTSSADKFRQTPPNCRLGDYANFLVDVFFKGKFSPSYGGPAWGAVATVLADFVNGKITAEMMMDTAFTLCHNNGPIFNKGMLFESYSGEIYKILDVQRSGQIPQLVANKETKHHSNSSVQSLWSLCHKALPVEFSGYVDWYKVEELGAMKSYPAQKQAQLQKYGAPGASKAKGLADAVKDAIKAHNDKAEQDMWVEIMPGVKVKKVEVVR